MSDTSTQMRNDMAVWRDEFNGSKPAIGWAAIGLLIMLIRIGISILEKLEEKIP